MHIYGNLDNVKTQHICNNTEERTRRSQKKNSPALSGRLLKLLTETNIALDKDLSKTEGIFSALQCVI